MAHFLIVYLYQYGAGLFFLPAAFISIVNTKDCVDFNPGLRKFSYVLYGIAAILILISWIA